MMTGTMGHSVSSRSNSTALIAGIFPGVPWF
jgi:hypothetical protein